MATLSTEFYEACKSLQNAPGSAKLVTELNKYFNDLADELIDKKEYEDTLKLQGHAQGIRKILKGFQKADEVVRRIEGSTSGAGPTIQSIT